MDKIMLKELNEDQILNFFELIGEIECGDHIDFENEIHINWLNKKINSNLNRGVKYFSLQVNNENVGLAGILFNEQLDGKIISSEIIEIGILKNHRDKGYGSILLNEVEKYCKSKNIYVLGAFTYARDYKVISYYGKNGLTPVSVIPDLNGPNDDGQIYMRKIIG